MKCYSKPSIDITRFQFESILSDSSIDIDTKSQSFTPPTSEIPPSVDGKSGSFKIGW